MSVQCQEPKFNSKELNKILPSYLLEEIDNEEKKEENINVKNESFDSPTLKESNVVRKKYFNLKNIFIFLFIQEINNKNSSKKKPFVNKSINGIHNEKDKKKVNINDYQNGLKDNKYFPKIQKLNLELGNKDEEKNSDESFSNEKIIRPINNNSNLLSQIIQNNQRKILSSQYNNIVGNIVGNTNNNMQPKDNYSFYKFNNFSSNNINNFNTIVNQINNNKNGINNDVSASNLSFSFNQNLNGSNINLFQCNNKINNFNIIPNLNQINANMGNRINLNTFHSINNMHNINYMINNKIILEAKDTNITNSNNNFNFGNALKHESIINNQNQINNNINFIKFLQNNLIKNNTNNKNFINDNINNIFKKKNNNDNICLNSCDKLGNKSLNNNLDISYIEDFLKYIKTLSMPLVNFLCSPKGTLEIQKKLGKANNECKIILIKLLDKEGLTTIMKNIYGNYFFQQMIKNTEEIIISLIISYISPNFIEISKDSSGTFSIQALLSEVSSVKEIQEILNCIKNHEMEMAFNKNATYVLQKIVLLFPDIHRIYLNDIILNNFKELCLDCNGICLIKNFIKTNTLLNNKKRINEEISKNFNILAESPFGNYGIQYIMDNWNKNELNDVKKKIIDNLYKLSIQQFSSNVVEKGIEIFDEDSREKIIKKLCFEGNFITLLKNKFGRFVLNKAINYMKNDLKSDFEFYLLNNINNNIYCHKDRNKVKKFLMKINSNNFENDCNLDLNKEYIVRRNMSNIYNYNFFIQNTNN